jgi:hypothetical protein
MSSFQNIHAEEIYLRGELLQLGSTTIEGTPGERGETGDIGPQGSQGIRGLQGGQGITGLTGLTGSIGLTGPAGAVTVVSGSDPDTTYLQGPVGIQGPSGIQGIDGIQGQTGLTGSIGLTGNQGNRGDVGSLGLTGLQGITGQQGPQGPSGPAGINTVVTVAGETISITGPAGANGADAIFDFQKISVADGVGSIVLPDPTTVVETGLYYYKDAITTTDTTFTLQNGLIVGKFYASRTQHITFLKSGNLWIN